ncbi:NADPH-dependent oxidoreductase [Priestia abyssalis]|uniref:NADPH-dependent oxidoreductase n=1 Tax=Priestia abyssalis TaxID=1221450 RepID=UPI0009950647|nr:NADPH-dependent oxidoreductase [Priestia abyssalis]
MNEVIKTLTNHRSFRQYLNTPVNKKELDAIIHAAQSGPSWIHGQQVSVIIVKDSARKKRLAELCGHQDHINQAPVFLIFCADFHRAKLASEIEGVSFEVADDADSLLVGAADVGIALANAIAAAESLGLGTVPIGGIRRSPLEVIEFLQLPKYVIPISGLCIGYGGNDPGLNPRLPKEAFYHEETYNENQMDMLQHYNETMAEHRNKTTNGKSDANWTERIAGFYSRSHYNNAYPDVPRMLQQQGFTCKDMKDES